jgi:predicted GNAT family N-acyltransferase
MTGPTSGEPWTVRAAAGDDLSGALALRHAVFCVEQGVPEELEHDEHDAAALHLVAVADGAVVGTCRLLFAGASARLQRMAVARSHRGRGVGADLLGGAHREARAAGATEVELHAQLTARDFYARAGYVAEGGEFEDAGIPHVLMRRPLTAPPR